MSLPVRTQVKVWSAVALAFFVVLWFLGDVLLPFVVGAAIAYLLDPIADWFESHGLSRAISVSIITLGGFLFFFLLFLLVIPTLAEEATALFQTIPELALQFQDFLTARLPSLVDAESMIRRSLASVGSAISSKGTELLQGAFASFSGLVNVLTLLVIVPVVSFYLLLDWDRLVARVDDLLPRDHVDTIRKIAREIDDTLSGFIRGQGLVCLLLGLYYCIGLFLVGLDFGLLVGALAGLLTFIPYVGALVGGILAIGLALFQFWGDWTMIAIVVAIFFSGQFLEGNVLTPKLVGESVGLHPVWLLMALTVFGALFGFVGMLVAVPLSAVIGVIVRFFAEQYKKGKLYRGQAATREEAAAMAHEAAETQDSRAPTV
ncbi:AI-2E family transporter [Tropicimonas isoalkanivorans]|uniref:Predicted PurR-regulated permease PerM n=1 Tax=Tropicimonas isoalkanivorans TaxID=441112 RepID=A0A1I1JEB3_9RHOB|nr:AI-2E family transporter [Tropicimonas isoalkanivorans]SFC46897.1 Predicted PurR-regulated permease PerM [Tropicimonas isoalkanivorans]